MNIAVGDRVRALEDCRMVGRGTSRYFYRAGDTGTVEHLVDLGAWVRWDGNHIDDGVWYASLENLALIEEDTSGIDVLAVMEEAEANTYAALSARVRDARAAVAGLIEAAADAAELLESVAPHHPQVANLHAALAQKPALSLKEPVMTDIKLLPLPNPKGSGMNWTKEQMQDFALLNVLYHLDEAAQHPTEPKGNTMRYYRDDAAIARCRGGES